MQIEDYNFDRYYLKQNPATARNRLPVAMEFFPVCLLSKLILPYVKKKNLKRFSLEFFQLCGVIRFKTKERQTTKHKHNGLTSGKLFTNDQRAVGFVSSYPRFNEASYSLNEGA